VLVVVAADGNAGAGPAVAVGEHLTGVLLEDEGTLGADEATLLAV
jgi:hypothetical protein